MPPPKGHALLRFIEKQHKNKETGCRIWTASKNDAGYGRFWNGEFMDSGNVKMVLAHRWFWEYFYGPLPEGIELHHVCENRSCVAPPHMEPLTRDEHGKRHRFKCGHSQSENNVYHNKKGSTICLTCHRERSKLWYRRQKAKDQAA